MADTPNPSPPTKASAAAAASVAEITRALAAPFDPLEVKFKPQMVKNNRALAIAYIDARVIQDRLDEVLGTENWQDEYECLPDGSVVCRLQLRLGERLVTKMDVGSPSEQPDSGDRLKAAFSDALKRAAVKFGIGRYLYRLPSQWVDYDPLKKQFVRTPPLPAFALPKKSGKNALRELPAAAEEADAPVAVPVKAAARRTSEPKPAKGAAKTSAHALPADGTELQRRLEDYDAKLAAQGRCDKGELLQFVAQEGAKAGHGTDLTAWSGEAIALAVEATKLFGSRARQRPPQPKVA
jgi:hypothetical protein